MGCGCKGNKVIQGVVNIQSQVDSITEEVMLEKNRGQINDKLCVVSLWELQDLMFKTKIVLGKVQHSEIEKGQPLIQKWFENYGFECPDRKQFLELKKLVEDEYSKSGA